MLITSALYCLLLLLPAELQSIHDDLGSSEYKVRKNALSSAQKLSPEKKRILIKELKKSDDPELTETAKTLSLFLPEALNKEKILKYILDGNYEKIQKALEINPSAFQVALIGEYNAADLAMITNRKDFITLFKNAGLRPSSKAPLLMDVLVVETDTWETLANDFNCNAKLLEMINTKGLKPGAVIKVPRSR